MNDPTYQASVGDIVDRRDLTAAITLSYVAFNIFRSVGPALGGVILASCGPLAALVLSTLCRLVPLIVVWRCRWQSHTSSPPARIPEYCDFQWRPLRRDVGGDIVSSGVLFGSAGIAALAVLPFVVRDNLQSGLVVYGALIAGFGGGALLAGLFSGLLSLLFRDEGVLKLVYSTCAACSLLHTRFSFKNYISSVNVLTSQEFFDAGTLMQAFVIYPVIDSPRQRFLTGPWRGRS